MHYNPTRNNKINQAFGKMCPSTAASLINKIEGKRAKGYDDPTFDLILPFARSILQSAGSKAARDATVLRSFCIPFEDMLVNNGPSHIQSGRINRQSIIPVWKWVGTQLIPSRISELTDEINAAVEAEDLASLRATCSVLYVEAAKAMKKALARALKNEKARQHLSVRLGQMTGIEDAMEMVYALRHAQTIGELRDRLPASITSLDANALSVMTKLFLEFYQRLPDKPGIITASFLTRLKIPDHILHIPVKALGSTDAGAIAASPFSVMGDILLFDIDRSVNDVISQLQKNMAAEDVLARLEEFHQRISGFTEQIDVSLNNPWGERLARSRTRISDLLEREIRQAPVLMREYVKDNGNQKKAFVLPASGKSKEAGPALSQAEKKLVRTLRLIKGCKAYLDQLSINNAMRSVENDLHQVNDFARMIGKCQVLTELEKITNRVQDFSTAR